MNPTCESDSSSDKKPRSRGDLALWLTTAEHPLTARVFVNRIWQYHFGRGLSETPSDFGVMGSEPTHPKLLDWLATEFVRTGWDLKNLHRLILTSETYRQCGSLPAEGPERERWQKQLEIDPNATWLARFPRRRLEGELVRDAMLAVSGSLNNEVGGPAFVRLCPRNSVKLS